MTQKDTGGPAYPVEETRYGLGKEIIQHEGMTLRDYFAAQCAMGCMISGWEDSLTVDQNARTMAVWSYAMADAMIAARKENT